MKNGERGRERNPVVAYGDAHFPPTGRGERPVPTVSVRKRCANHFDITFVPEYNTTKVCHRCDEHLCPVTKEAWVHCCNERLIPVTKREVRGLRWCRSTQCLTFRDRDGNAARNILRCLMSYTNRPVSLTRDNPNAPGSPKVLPMPKNPRATTRLLPRPNAGPPNGGQPSDRGPSRRDPPLTSGPGDQHPGANTPQSPT